MIDPQSSGPEPADDPALIKPRWLPSPLPYHRHMQAFLEDEYPEIWRWFASETFHREDRERLHLELLKSTYRLSPEDHPDLHAKARRAMAILGIEAPVHLYQSQSQDAADGNAMLAYVPGEIHLIFEGPILERLDPEEIDSLLGHELAHFLFFEQNEHRHFTASRILGAMARDELSDQAHVESVRLNSLYTEILADRGAFAVSRDIAPPIRLLVKVRTGAETVNAETYLQQAAEIFEREQASTQGLTHPEVFIRARALQLWASYTDDPSQESAVLEERVAEMIHGFLRFEALDLLAQSQLRAQTRTLIQELLAPPWMRTEAALAHAELFFNDFEVDDFEVLPPDVEEESSPAFKAIQDPELGRYFAYVLTDFIALTRELEEGAVAMGFKWADILGIGEELAAILHKELKMPKRVLARIQAKATSILLSLNAAGPERGSA